MSADDCTQIYQVLGSVVHLAMSADSSCRGLRSARDGPVLMELTQGRYGIHSHIIVSVYAGHTSSRNSDNFETNCYVNC